MSDLGGFVGGMEAGQQAYQSKQLFNLTLQEGQQKLQEGAFKLQEAPLDVKAKELSVKTAQRALDAQDAIMRAMQGRAGGTSGGSNPTDSAQAMADNLFAISAAETQAGQFDAAGKHAQQASAILKNNAAILKDQQVAQRKSLTDVADIMSGVPESSQGWEQAKTQFLTLHPDEAKDPQVQSILKTPYKPGLVKAVRDAVIGAKDKSEIQKNQAQAADAYAQAKRAEFDRTTVMPARAKEAEARAEHLDKAGAGNLNPKPADVKRIVDLALQDYPMGADDPIHMADLRNRSLEVAAIAKDYEVNHGLTPAAAARKAYVEARQRKLYDGADHISEGMGSKPSNALPITPEIKANPKLLEKNKYYATGSSKLPGGIGKWNGESFDPPDEPNTLEEDEE